MVKIATSRKPYRDLHLSDTALGAVIGLFGFEFFRKLFRAQTLWDPSINAATSLIISISGILTLVISTSSQFKLI